MALTSHEPAWERAASVLASTGLAVCWVAGYRRGRFSLASEPLEAFAVFVVLHFTPGDPLLPLLGMIFRSLYGGSKLAFARYVTWMGMLFLAHADRSSVEQHADISRAMGTALAPIMAQALLGALRASETIQRRLTSIVQNSTDVVTIVGADFRIRWQAASIRGVLAQDPDALVGTKVRELIHPDDR